MPNWDYTDNILPESLYKPLPKMEAPALMGNLYALTHRDEVLAQKQTDQILGMASQFKTEDLDYELASKAQREIEDFKSSIADMYAGNKGMARLTLTPEQRLNVSKMQKDLMQSIGWGKQATKYWGEAQKLMARAMEKGTISPADFAEWSNNWETTFKDKKTTLSDVGNPYLDAVNYLKTKPQIAEGALPKDKLAFFKALNYAQTGETVGEYDPNKTVKAFETQLTPQDIGALKNRWGMSAMSDDEFKQWALTGAKENFNPAELRGRSGGQFSINIGGGKNKYRPTEEVVDNVKYHNISGKAPTDTYGNYTGKYTAIRENTDGTADVFMTQIVDGSGKIMTESDSGFASFMKSAGGKKDPNKKGGFWMPYTKSVEGVLQQNDIITENIKVKKYAGYTPQEQTAEKKGGEKLSATDRTRITQHPSTKVTTPDGDMTVAQLMKAKGLTADQIINGIEKGILSLSK